MHFDFKDRVIVITGAARGQGLREAELLVQNGAKVVMCDIQEDLGRAAAERLGASATFVKLDVAQEKDWKQTYAVAERIGPISGLINNAGIYSPHPINETSTANFEDHFKVNQLGAFFGMKIYSEHMRKNRFGSIVNIGSAAGMRGSPNSFSYCATKWALRGMSKALAADIAKDNVRVNFVAPGPVNTEMIKIRSDEENLKKAHSAPMGRLADVDDVVPLVLFLLSDMSQYITGAEIVIDGGMYL